MAKTITEVQTGIVECIRALDVECFYPGIRVDVAARLGIAPNNPLFQAAFDSLEWWQSGPGNLCAGVPWEGWGSPLIRQRF